MITSFESETKVQQLWSQHFRDVPLIEPRWFEHHDPVQLAKALAIAAERDKQGRFPIRTQEHIGKYVNGVVRRLKIGAEVKLDTAEPVIELKVTVKAGYEITESDKQRFKNKLGPSGDCLLFNGAKHAGGYGRFYVNGSLIGAHKFAFFMEGHLPAEGEIEGLEIAHTCKVRGCCNPRHLRLTSKRVNLAERAYDRNAGDVDFIAVNSSPLLLPSSPLPSAPSCPVATDQPPKSSTNAHADLDNVSIQSLTDTPNCCRF